MRIGMYNARVGTFETGGTETFIREMARQMSDDHNVILYTGSGDIVSPVSDLNVTIKEIPFLSEDNWYTHLFSKYTPIHTHEIEALSMYVSARKKSVYRQMAEEVDVVSTHSLLENALVSRIAPVPVVFRVPGIRRGSPRWRFLLRYDDSTLRLSNSEATSTRLQERVGVGTDGVVYAGLDLDQFSPKGPAVDRPEDPLLLYLGRVDEGKGLFDLLNAHKRLHKTHPTVLRIVGDGELTDTLRDRVNELGTADHVEFVGSVPHSEVQRHYRAADVYCLPSYSEGFPLGNIEAMACGLPVVSTDIAPVREQISNEDNGLLFPPGDVAALTDRLKRLFTSPDERVRIAEAGREWVQRLSWERQAELLESYYQQAINDE